MTATDYADRLRTEGHPVASWRPGPDGSVEFLASDGSILARHGNIEPDLPAPAPDPGAAPDEVP